jgi:hypothetical protein
MDITVDDLLLQMEASLGSLAAAINRDLDPAERISTMVIATGPWTVGNGLITPTLKIRRSSFGRRFPMRAARHSRRPQAARSMRPARDLGSAAARRGPQRALAVGAARRWTASRSPIPRTPPDAFRRGTWEPGWALPRRGSGCYSPSCFRSGVKSKAGLPD